MGWLLFFTAGAWGSGFTISRLETKRVIPFPANAFIVPDSGKYLNVVYADSTGTGGFYLRKKFSKQEYVLYGGKRVAGSAKSLSCFHLPGSTLGSRAVLKLYTSTGAPWYQDISEVYLDDNYIYAKDIFVLHYNKGGSWVSLKALEVKPSNLFITSLPSGAHVYSQGAFRGLTPLTLTGLTGRSLLLQFNLEGHYGQEAYIRLPAGGDTSFHASLKFKAAGIHSIDSLIKNYLQDSAATGDEFTRRIGQLRSRLAGIQQEMERALKGFENDYPSLSPKGEFETTDAFTTRQGRYHSSRALQKGELQASWLAREVSIRRALDTLSIFKQRSFARFQTHEFPAEYIKLAAYNADSGYFPITIKVNEDAFNFGFKGRLLMPLTVAPGFKSDQKGGRLLLSYINRQIKLKDLSSVFYGLEGLDVRYLGVDYACSGQFTFSAAIISHPEYKGFMARRQNDNAARLADSARAVRVQKASGKLKPIPAGCFDMGSLSGQGDEKPVHKVCVNAFKLDSTEVTQAEFEEARGVNPSHFKGCSSCPADRVTWSEASDYCASVGKRLPTEAEWEYAASGRITKDGTAEAGAALDVSAEGATTKPVAALDGTAKGATSKPVAALDGTAKGATTKPGAALGGIAKGASTSGAADLSQFGWFDGKGKRTHPVALKRPNARGLYDMTGNVWEWAADWYDESYYSRSPSSNPQGPDTGSGRVLRGGGWFSSADNARVSVRNWAKVDKRSNGNGFRCAVTSSGPSQGGPQ